MKVKIQNIIKSAYYFYQLEFSSPESECSPITHNLLNDIGLIFTVVRDVILDV